MYAPSWILLALCLAPSTLSAQGATKGGKLRWTLRGESVPNGSTVGLVQRRRGKPTTFRVMTLDEHGWEIPLPAPRDKGVLEPMMLFAVAGLTKIEEFDDFLAHPERWDWAAKQVYAMSGTITTSSTFSPKGKQPDYFGFVQGPDGQPLDELDVDFFAQHEMRARPESLRTMTWGYDPCTGRFWAGISPYDLAWGFMDWRFDLKPYGWGTEPRSTIAPLLRFDWKKGVEVTAKLPVAGIVDVRVPGLEDARIVSYAIKLLRRDAIAEHEFHAQIDRDGRLHFCGLPSGNYTLDIRLAGASVPIYQHPAIVVYSGKATQLGTVDLSDKVKNIVVTIHSETSALCHAGVGWIKPSGGYTSSSTGDRMPLIVPINGVDLMVFAEGHGTQFFASVKEDLRVTLEPPRQLRIELDREDEVPSELLKDLYLCASQGSEAPRWAVEFELRRGAAMRRANKGKDPVLLNGIAALENASGRIISIPNKGSWTFELVYGDKKFALSERVHLPYFNAVTVDQKLDHLKIRLPLRQLRRAHDAFTARK